MILYADKSGAIIRLVQTAQEARDYPDAPPGTVESLEIDPATNPQLAKSLATSTDGWSLVKGQLSFKGELVQVAPASKAVSERASALQLAQALDAYLGLLSPTAAQTTAAVKVIARLVLVVVRLLIIETKDV